jgi:cellulose biosynthesis protein BcsQ
VRKIGIHIEKGGSGKTTTAGNVGFELSKRGRTLLVDCDPQGNLSSWYVTSPVSFDLSDVLQGRAKLAAAVVQVRPGLDVLPTIAIEGDLKRWAESSPVQFDRAFGALVHEIEGLGYVYAIFDLSPGISSLERSVLAQVDEIIGVVKAEYFSFDGLEVFKGEIERLRAEYRVNPASSRLVVNMISERITLHETYRSRLRALDFELFDVHNSVRVAETPTLHLAVAEHEPEGRAAAEFRALAEALA